MLSTNDTNEFFLNSKMLEDVQILLADNDRDSRDLYAVLLEDQGAKVTGFELIEEALDFLDGDIPNLLICEMRFLGESVVPLIQRVRSLAFSNGRPIPILGISTCDPISLAQQLTVNIEAYLRKPIDIGNYVDQVWNLARSPNTVYPQGIQAWVFAQNPVQLLCSGEGVN
jgi:CheY-like chemotaxis protein